MSKPPITFRLNDLEYQLLEKEKREDESINQTASRLLRERLGIREEINPTLDKQTIDEIIAERINLCFEGFKSIYEDYISEVIETKVNARIEELKPKPATRKPPTRTTKSKTIV